MPLSTAPRVASSAHGRRHLRGAELTPGNPAFGATGPDSGCFRPCENNSGVVSGPEGELLPRPRERPLAPGGEQSWPQGSSRCVKRRSDGPGEGWSRRFGGGHRLGFHSGPLTSTTMPPSCGARRVIFFKNLGRISSGVWDFPARAAVGNDVDLWLPGAGGTRQRRWPSREGCGRIEGFGRMIGKGT